MRFCEHGNFCTQIKSYAQKSHARLERRASVPFSYVTIYSNIRKRNEAIAQPRKAGLPKNCRPKKIKKKMKNGKHFLIVYDIRDGKRLRKVAKVVSSYAMRVQKSVFETDANDAVIAKLKRRLQKIIDENADFVLFFELCERDWQKREKFGKGAMNEMQNERYQIL